MKPFILLLMIVFIFSCKNTKNKLSSKNKTVLDTKGQIYSGKKLMETNCYVCHNPTAERKDRIAPPMVAIKKHYIKSNTTKEEFRNSMQNWIENPTKENVKMFGAVKRFGLMPKQTFPDETIKVISDYMFDNEIEQPVWFENHYNKEKGKRSGVVNKEVKQKEGAHNSFNNLPYNERGLKYALMTKSVLGKSLMSTIQKEGTLAALNFCNERAYPLTDSVSIIHKAIIKRVSDKPRNDSNTANEVEKGYIAVFKSDIKNKRESKAIVVESDKSVEFYYPIKTNSMCLQCHGKPVFDIKNNILTQINNLYPKDKAIGYKENEVRGIWSIKFNKK
ncbi:DUF3365 domain-containing protein [Tenacibaculum ovolyticum]|uniref:Tll0287-like domain-containing protein n=1 Tax=Tenacibaculum ovolyticum TaxID=104270 RepID=UPI0022F3B42B|nr:DUF3365 domain-containing protein [Tenacibaculum ovolyticum]WBX76981.1 DUF3365 domain-containing protein [Tenacibaculum ovolyticum]